MSNAENAPDEACQKKSILPAISLALDFMPVLCVLLALINRQLLAILPIGILLPIVGIVLGIVSLCLGRKRIGTIGVVLSSTAVALPVIFIAALLLIPRFAGFLLGM
ncbi:MAG: hypothetical protein LBC41_00290 [Clostridiales bacterium]|jgi:hypothetical protein|nr:hypothetical protein [Clostridiales bacterium]